MKLNDMRPVTLCKYCNEPTRATRTKMCDACWEVDSRIEQFMKTENGRLRVMQILTKEGVVVWMTDEDGLKKIVEGPV